MAESLRKNGTLFVVATPIGNLSDITFRAVETLSSVDLIAAEDTRHSRPLLARYSIKTPTTAYHEHNEQRQARRLLEMLRSGKSVALISDAGTPLLSDPGYRLIREARREGVRVSPVPGCCAAIAALSVAGLPAERFAFEGFLPAKTAARRKRLEGLAEESRTLIFYESAHRILDALSDMVGVFGADRSATLARELTKKFETVRCDQLSGIRRFVLDDVDQQRGEFVVLVHGAAPADGARQTLEAVLTPLMEALPLKQAVELTARITGRSRNDVYQTALEQKSGTGRRR